MRKEIEAPNDIYIVESSAKQITTIDWVNANAYLVPIKFLSSKAYNTNALGFIDTGAANTVITIKSLYRNITQEQYRILTSALSERKSTIIDFSSAKGKKDVKGWLCTLPVIEIGGSVIKDFPFYLVDDLKKKLVLIGYDFTSSCDMVQLKDEPISFYNFDINSMYSKMNGSNPLNLLSLGI